MSRTSVSWARSAATALTVVVAAVFVAGCSSASSASGNNPGDGARDLVGLFRLTPGVSAGVQLTGTWFKMLQPGANIDTGPYMVNADSSADGGQATLLQPGTAGGFRSGGYQSEPTPAFDTGGNSNAAAITTPTKFFGVKFSISTNPVDPQTQTKVAPPTVELKGDKLVADMSSWAASWNNQNFNQGSPKPVSNTQAKAPGQAQAQRVWDWVSNKWLDSAPAPTVSGSGATGTFDAKTGAFVLQWTSLIVGGPFNGFTGLWHLQGSFRASTAAPSGA